MLLFFFILNFAFAEPVAKAAPAKKEESSSDDSSDSDDEEEKKPAPGTFIFIFLKRKYSAKLFLFKLYFICIVFAIFQKY